MRNIALPVSIAGIWINLSEFFRNEILFKSFWVEHYRNLGLAFPSGPVNGVVWMLWGFVFAGLVLAMTRRFSLVETTLMAWVAGFLLMWLVAWNLSVLPVGILLAAVPLSLLETLVASVICKRLTGKRAS